MVSSQAGSNERAAKMALSVKQPSETGNVHRPAADAVVPCIVCGTGSFRNLFSKDGFDFIACTQCELVRLDPLPTAAELDAHYGARATDGNYRFEASFERASSDQKTLAKVEQRGSPGKGRIFDIGCLYGQFLDFAGLQGWETWGLELQAPAAEHAARRHPGRISCTTVEAFNLAPSAPLGTFDAVVASGVIEHALDPTAILDVALKLLKPGGLLLLQTPNHGSLLRRMMGKYWPPYAAPEHTFYFSAANLKRFVEAKGFEAVKTSADVKFLRVEYVLQQLQYFGKEIQRLVRPFQKFIPGKILRLKLPFYGGEMFLSAYKKF
jgi:SAM-dependent methyltransferase